MLYSPSKNFIFVHIYKTAGKSIDIALRPYCPPYYANRAVRKAVRVMPGPARMLIGWHQALVCGQHMTAAEIRRKMPAELFDRAYKFTIVRNPWDWQVSQYFYMIQTKAHPEHETIRALASFDDYIRYRCDRAVQLQSAFVHDAAGRRIVDRVGRFESLGEDFELICRDIGIDARLPYQNASRRDRDWRGYYSDETFDLVARTFREDIALFGYGPEGLADTAPVQGHPVADGDAR